MHTTRALLMLTINKNSPLTVVGTKDPIRWPSQPSFSQAANCETRQNNRTPPPQIELNVSIARQAGDEFSPSPCCRGGSAVASAPAPTEPAGPSSAAPTRRTCSSTSSDASAESSVSSERLPALGSTARSWKKNPTRASVSQNRKFSWTYEGVRFTCAPNAHSFPLSLKYIFVSWCVNQASVLRTKHFEKRGMGRVSQLDFVVLRLPI